MNRLDDILGRDREICAFARMTERLDHDAVAKAHGPLVGATLAVKDLIDVRGLPTGCGSPIHAESVAAADAESVARALRAGLVVMGKTKLSEFATFEPCNTRNPLNLAHTPGGSSSGSAAAVAGGLTRVALGTQTAGSVIRPAAYCGTVGFLPTAGSISLQGVRVLSPSLDRIGLFSRDVADAVALAHILCDGIEFDVSTPAAPRVGFFPDSTWAQADEATRAAIERARGAVIESGGLPVTLDEFVLRDEFERAQRTLQEYEVARSLAPELASHPELISARLHALCADGRAIDRATYDEALRTAARGRAWIVSIFETVDAIACPAAKTLPPLMTLGSTGDPWVNRAWSLLGVPCTSLPTGALPSGLRGAVQLVGPLGGDGMLAAIAATLECAVARIPPTLPTGERR